MDSSGAVGLDESPDTPPLHPLPEPRKSRRPLFYSQQEEPETEEDSLPPTVGEDGDAGSSTGDPWTSESDGWNDDELPTSTASPAGDKPVTQLLSKKQMRDTARGAVKIGTGMAHTVAANTEAKKAVGLYLADDEDAENIGDPLADIMYRRGDVVGGKLSPDANSALQALMGLAHYFTKQIGKIGVVRQIEAGQAAGEVQPIPRDVA
jgi:hypothetical protein